MTAALHATPARRIVNAIADAAERWADADFPPRVRVLDGIVARTGYSLPVVEYALDRIFFSLTAEALEATIEGELGGLDALDAVAGSLPHSVCIISSRTTIGVAIVPAMFALCAKCDVLVKDREDGLVRAFFATLAEELDALGVAARAEAWNGASDVVDLGSFDVVIGFGNDETLQTIQSRVSPSARFVANGSKMSIGYIARESLRDTAAATAIARGAARDLLLYDSEGCLSLNALFIESGGELAPLAFMQTFAREIERAAVEFPPGTPEAAARAAVAHARDGAAFRAAAGKGAVFSDSAASYLAVLDPPSDAPPLLLPRSLSVYTVANVSDASTYLNAHKLPIEAVATSEERNDIGTMATHFNARLTTFGELQNPPLNAKHGGHPRIAEFVRG